jgi:Galactose oxidase, central domain
VVEVGLLFGGETASGDLLNDTWVFNFESCVWKPVEPLGEPPCSRKLHSLTQLPCGNRIALFGGYGCCRREMVWLIAYLNDVQTWWKDTIEW